MHVPRAQTPLAMRSNACDPVDISGYWQEATTRSLNWSLQASIRFKPQRRRNAGRLTDIVQGWCSEKVPQFLDWKTSTAPSSVARLFLQRLSAMAFLPIIFTSHSRILQASDRIRRCNELFKVRTFQRTQSITSMRTERPRCSTTQPKARQSAGYLTAYR